MCVTPTRARSLVINNQERQQPETEEWRLAIHIIYETSCFFAWMEREDVLVQLRLTEKQLEQALEDQARADEELGSLREEVQYLRYVQSHNPSCEGTSEQARVDRELQNPTAQSRRLEECENEIEENRHKIGQTRLGVGEADMIG